MTRIVEKDIVAQFYDLVWIKRDMEQARGIISPDCVRHDPSGPVPTGPEGFAAMVDKWRAAFSDFSLNVDFMLAEPPHPDTPDRAAAGHRHRAQSTPAKAASSTCIRKSALAAVKIIAGRILMTLSCGPSVPRRTPRSRHFSTMRPA